MKTTRMRSNEPERGWVLFNAEGKTLGRLAADIAVVLAGKNKPTYQPDIEMGDHVVVINAGKFRVTGKKMSTKFYYRHSGYVGHLHQRSLADLLKVHPDHPLWYAVRGMLPKNKLRNKLMKRLHLYAGPTHPHTAQRPLLIESAYTYSAQSRSAGEA